MILLLCLFLVCAELTRANIFGDERGESGFIEIESSYQIFYWVFPARKKTSNTPLLLWLEGGPGCSSLISIFEENGPFKVTEELTIKQNPYSWNEEADLLYVDQPIGTGYSNCNNAKRIPDDEEAAAKDMDIFFEKFLAEWPKYDNKDFYIAGQSYGGHYVPYFAAHFLKVKPGNLRLKGVAIGNGLYKGSSQMLNFAEFGVKHELPSRTFTYLATKINFHMLHIFARIGLLRWADFFFHLGIGIAIGLPPRFNMYNYKRLEPYNRTLMSKFILLPEVREELKVGDRVWVPCSWTVYDRMVDKDVQADMSPYVLEMLDPKNELKVIIFSGEQDWMCNTEGVIQYFEEEIEWEHRQEFKDQEWKDWVPKNEKAGRYKRVANFHFYEVAGAGHMVSYEKPIEGLAIAHELMFGSS